MTRLDIEAVASGGDGIGHLDGKVVFVSGAIPGDSVRIEMTADKKRFARGRVLDVESPSADRIAMPCPHAEECGGCTWQMVHRRAQLRWKQQAVVDALRRIGGLDAPVRPIAAPGPDFRYRNRLDLHPSPDGPGFYAAGSRTLVPIRTCLLGVPAVEDLLAGIVGRPVRGPVTIRVGVATGESVVIGRDHVSPSNAVISEEVDGAMFRISGLAFFQPNTDGAEALVGFVREATVGAGDGLFVDVFAGVGLFSATVGTPFPEVIAIESDRVAARDLAVNADGAHVLQMSAEEGLAGIARAPAVVIVDPPRTGLDPATVAALVASGSDLIVSVSCDAATFARDARALVDAGYELEWVQPVDQFPQTPHIETVARFVR